MIFFAAAHKMVVINTFFKKAVAQYFTFNGGSEDCQMDFVLSTKNNIAEGKNCKIIKNECVANLHRPVIIDQVIGIKWKGAQTVDSRANNGRCNRKF